jgi:ABC-type amino acid transport substrate-binding protein
MGNVLLALAGGFTLANAQGGSTVIAVRGNEASPLMDATSDDQANWRGLEWDMIQYLCDPDAGYLRNCSFIRTTSLGERYDLLANKTADVVIAGAAATEDRCDRRFKCIHPFYYGYSGHLYTTPDIAATIESYADIKGKTICEWEGGSFVGPLKDLGASIHNTELRSDAVENINDGKCIALSAEAAWSFVPEELVRVDLPSFTNQSAPVLVSRDAEPALVSSLQAGISSMYQSGSKSVILDFEDTHIVSPGYLSANEEVATQVAAISNFNTPVGREGFVGLPAEFGKEFAGIEKIEGSGTDPFDVTIATWTENLPPLYAPTSPEGGSGSYGGIEGALIQKICARESINCESFVDAETLDERFTALDEGKANITIGAITIDQSRLEQYPFVTPFYYSTGMGLFTTDDKKSEYADIDSLEALKGLKICSEVGALWKEVLEEAGAIVQEVASAAAAEAAVKDDDCEMFAYDSAYAVPNLSMLPSIDPSTTSPYGIALAADSSPALYSELVAAMISIIEDEQLSEAAENAAAEAGATLAPQLKSVTNIISTLDESMGGSLMPAPSPDSAFGTGIVAALISIVLVA